MTLFLLLGLCASGQTSAEKGKAVIDEAVRALGGERFLSVRNVQLSGRLYSFFREQVSGTAAANIFTRYVPIADTSSLSPLAVQERQSFLRRSEELYAVLLNGTDGYEVTFRGARPIPEDSLDRYRITTLTSILYILRVRLNEPGILFEYRGQDVWSNQSVHIVDITDSENRVVTVYFNQASKLPIHQVYYRRDPKTRRRIEEVSDYGKYRDAGDGVQWPLTVQRTRDGVKVYEMYADSAKINQSMSDSLFMLPAGVKMQKKL
jgi:hypothetical protein